MADLPDRDLENGRRRRASRRSTRPVACAGCGCGDRAGAVLRLRLVHTCARSGLHRAVLPRGVLSRHGLRLAGAYADGVTVRAAVAEDADVIAAIWYAGW